MVTKERGRATLPYKKGLQEELCRIFKGFQGWCLLQTPTFHWQLLVIPKDPVKKAKCGVVYLISCEGGKEGEECGLLYW